MPLTRNQRFIISLLGPPAVDLSLLALGITTPYRATNPFLALLEPELYPLTMFVPLVLLYDIKPVKRWFRRWFNLDELRQEAE